MKAAATPRAAMGRPTWDIEDEEGGSAVRPRTLSLCVLAALIGAAIVVLPVLAAPSEAKLEVNENCVEPAWPCWATPGSSQPAAKVTIASGGSVFFLDGKTAANIAWNGAAPMCEPAVPVAPAPAKTGWEGRCTFSQPGIYDFESSTMWVGDGFNYTKYEVVVEGSSTTPTTGTTGGSGSTPTTTAPSSAPGGEQPAGSPLAGAPAIASRQRGATVKGSLQITEVGAGGRLQVELLATSPPLARSRRAARVVGRLVSDSVSAGARSFAVKLDPNARRALKRRHRLTLEVKITLTPPYGEAVSVTRSVVVHGS